jgi:membrane protein
MPYKKLKDVLQKRAHQAAERSKKIILPGSPKLSLYIVAKFFYEGLRNGALSMRAASLSFNFFLAIFPSVIFLFTLIPYIPINNFQDYLFNLLQEIMPQSAFKATEDTIIDIIKNPHGGLLSVGFLSALYFSTNGFNAMINSFNETYHQIETRSAIMQRLVALLMVIVNTLMIAVAIALIIYSEIVLGHIIHKDIVAYYLILFGKWIILFALCFCLISFNYYVGPKQKKSWHFFSVGSLFATVFIVIASTAFAYYVNNFGKYNKLYGSIGTLIVIMMLIYIYSLILLLGFDLNASIRSAKNQKDKDLTAAT